MACGKKTASSSLNSAAIDIPMTADGKVDTLKLPKFTFQNDTYDFGKITQGEKVSYSFNFKKNLSFGYVTSNHTNEELSKMDLYIEVAKQKYPAKVEITPLKDKSSRFL